MVIADIRAKDDLLSEGGQSLSSLTEQASDKACNQTGTHFHCYNLQKYLCVVICIFYLFHGQCLHGRPNEYYLLRGQRK